MTCGSAASAASSSASRLVLHVDGIDEADGRLPSRVDAAPEYRELERLVGVPGPVARGSRRQGLGGMIEWQLDFGQSKHRESCCRIGQTAIAGRMSGGPGPLEIVAAQLAGHVDHLADEIEALHEPRLHRAR